MFYTPSLTPQSFLLWGPQLCPQVALPFHQPWSLLKGPSGNTSFRVASSTAGLLLTWQTFVHFTEYHFLSDQSGGSFDDQLSQKLC